MGSENAFSFLQWYIRTKGWHYWLFQLHYGNHNVIQNENKNDFFSLHDHGWLRKAKIPCYWKYTKVYSDIVLTLYIGDGFSNRNDKNIQNFMLMQINNSSVLSSQMKNVKWENFFDKSVLSMNKYLMSQRA